MVKQEWARVAGVAENLIQAETHITRANKTWASHEEGRHRILSGAGLGSLVFDSGLRVCIGFGFIMI